MRIKSSAPRFFCSLFVPFAVLLFIGSGGSSPYLPALLLSLNNVNTLPNIDYPLSTNFLTCFLILTCSFHSSLISFTEIKPWDSNSLLANLKFSSSIFWDSRFLLTMFNDLGLKMVSLWLVEMVWLTGEKASTPSYKENQSLIFALLTCLPFEISTSFSSSFLLLRFTSRSFSIFQHLR